MIFAIVLDTPFCNDLCVQTQTYELRLAAGLFFFWQDSSTSPLTNSKRLL